MALSYYYSKLNKKHLEVVLSIHPEPAAPSEPSVQPHAEQTIEPKAPVERNAHQAHDKLSKMNLTELKALSKETGIKLSHYSKEKAKSIAKRLEKCLLVIYQHIAINCKNKDYKI